MEDLPVYQKKHQDKKETGSKLVMKESWGVMDIDASRVIHKTDSAEKAVEYIKKEINYSGTFVPLPIFTYEYFDI